MQASISRNILVSLVAVLAWAIAPAALADPPARIARLSYTTGAVSFSPALDPDNWAQASINRPFFIGDRLWTDANARAELEFGTAVVRSAPRTSVTVLNIDESITQLEVAEGQVSVRVRTLENGESFEIDTPNLAFAITRPGTYRVDVDPQGDSTIVAVRDGHGEVYGEGRSYIVDRGQWYRFYGTALDNDYARIPVADEFDRWALGRDARHDRSLSARYVPRTMIGYEDLDAYGSWSVVADYGNVWIPRSVPADWAPYRNGHWTWIDPWGWTWVDDAPWGFAPFHYGRWTRVQDRWGWVPGPTNVRPVYAPALVAFVGGSNFSVSIGGTSSRGVAWFPLAPGEVYRPSYQVSREYFTQVNVTNTRVNTTVVTNIYNSPDAVREVRYRHREPAAVTAVAVNTFVESRPVARAAVPVRQITQTMQAAPVVVAPVVAPARASVMGAAGTARVKPPEAVTRRQVVARTPPPQATPAFTPTQAAAGAAAPETNTLRETNRARAPRERVRVVTTTSQPATPAATAEHRGRPEGTPPRAGSAAAGGAPGATPVPGTATATPAAEAGTKGTPNGAAAGRGDRGPPRAPATAAGSPTTPSSTGAAPSAGSPPVAGQPGGRAAPDERDARGNGRANGRDRGADLPGAPAVNPITPPAAAPSAPPAPATTAPDAGRSPGAGKGPDENRDAAGRGARREAPQRTPEAPPAALPSRVPAPAAAVPAAGAPAGRNNGRAGGREEPPAAAPARPAIPAAAPAAEPPPASPAPAEPRQRGNARGRAPEAAPQPPTAAPAAPAPRSAEPPAAARPEAGARRAPPAATPAPVPVPAQAAPAAPPRAAPPAAPAAPAAAPAPAPAARPQPPAAAPAKGPGAQPPAPPAAPADAERGQGRGKDDKGDEQRRREKEKEKGKDKND